MRSVPDSRPQEYLRIEIPDIDQSISHFNLAAIKTIGLSHPPLSGVEHRLPNLATVFPPCHQTIDSSR
jgi:hypothetical protein